MSLFDKLKERIVGIKAAEEKSEFINIPKLDGEVPNTANNRFMVDTLKKADVGMGTVLDSSIFVAEDGFKVCKMDVLAKCGNNEEEYLLARTCYGIIDGVDENNIPMVKNFITQFDMEGMFLNDGKWDGDLHLINSFCDPIRLYKFEVFQPVSFRFNSAIFRADKKGGIVYQLAPNEKVVNINNKNNTFTIEKTEITRTDYVAITSDNQAYGAEINK